MIASVITQIAIIFVHSVSIVVLNAIKMYSIKLHEQSWTTLTELYLILSDIIYCFKPTSDQFCLFCYSWTTECTGCNVEQCLQSIRWNHSEDSVAVLAAAVVGTAEGEGLE